MSLMLKTEESSKELSEEFSEVLEWEVSIWKLSDDTKLEGIESDWELEKKLGLSALDIEESSSKAREKADAGRKNKRLKKSFIPLF